ncbi:MAG: DUF3499 family protein [Actinomycetota bacterium]
MTLCSKPGCQHTGAAVLAYDYADRSAFLEDAVVGELSPHVYVLCQSCAAAITPPRGWTLDDRRKEPALFLERLEERRAAGTAPAPETPGDTTAARQVFFGSSG